MAVRLKFRKMASKQWKVSSPNEVVSQTTEASSDEEQGVDTKEHSILERVEAAFEEVLPIQKLKKKKETSRPLLGNRRMKVVGELETRVS